jgi:uncharacterized membrane protein/biotin operon repressor
MASHFTLLAIALLMIGVLLVVISVVSMIGFIYMVKYMGGYMGMMRGIPASYGLVVPIIFLIVGIVIIISSLLAARQPIPSQARHEAIDDSVLRLLPEQERRVMEYLEKSGGEAFQYKVARDLAMSKVKSWRIIKRLEEKGLVEVVKVKGRNVVKIRGNNEKKGAS